MFHPPRLHPNLTRLLTRFSPLQRPPLHHNTHFHMSTSNLASYPSPTSVLQYWFGGEHFMTTAPQKSSFGLWFMKSNETDQHIIKTYGPLLDKLAQDEEFFDTYQNQDNGKVGTVVVLDQFSRNAYRNTRKSFSNDEKALKLANDLLADQEEWLKIPLWIRGFLLLPFEHSEEMDDQLTAVREFQKLVDEAKEKGDQASANLCEAFLDYAKKHLEVIEKYGRFPHRNEILGRKSTEEELEYLSKPGAGF